MEPTILIGSNATVSTFIPATVNIVHGTHAQLVAFLTLNIWPSHFGIPLLLGIIFLRKIQRHATFINLCVTFLIAGFASTLMLYAGRIEGPEPVPELCLLQASLLYGYPPMTSVAAFALVLQMFFVIRASYYGEEYLERDHVIRTWSMLIAPYVAFFTVVLTTAVVGAAKPSEVSRNRRFFYCSVRNNILTNSLTIFAALFLFATVFVEGWLVIILYKRYTALKSKGSPYKEKLDHSMPLRVLAYGLYSTIALSLSLLSINAPESPVPDLMIATASSVLLLIFGTQRDILRAMCFWRRSRPSVRPVEIMVSKDQDNMSYYNYDVERPL